MAITTLKQKAIGALTGIFVFYAAPAAAYDFQATACSADNDEVSATLSYGHFLNDGTPLGDAGLPRDRVYETDLSEAYARAMRTLSTEDAIALISPMPRINAIIPELSTLHDKYRAEKPGEFYGGVLILNSHISGKCDGAGKPFPDLGFQP